MDPPLDADVDLLWQPVTPKEAVLEEAAEFLLHAGEACLGLLRAGLQGAVREDVDVPVEVVQIWHGRRNFKDVRPF